MDPFDPLNTGNPDADKARRLIKWFRQSLGEKALKALAQKPKRPVAGLIAELGTPEHIGHQALMIQDSEIDEPLPGLIVGIADLKLIQRILRQNMGDAFTKRFFADNETTPPKFLIHCALKSGSQSAFVGVGRG
jgi:hypothetical protein